MYAREKHTEKQADGHIVTTLTYKTPTQAFSEQHNQMETLTNQVIELLEQVSSLKSELASVGDRMEVM